MPDYEHQPIWGRRLVIPSFLPVPGAGVVVHLVSPLFERAPYVGVRHYYDWQNNERFANQYCTCHGVLDNANMAKAFDVKLSDGTRVPLVRNLDWATWLRPYDTALTCFECMQREEAERARRRA